MEIKSGYGTTIHMEDVGKLGDGTYGTATASCPIDFGANTFDTSFSLAAAKTRTRGILVVYVAVGQLPPFKAEALLERAKEANADLVKRLKESNVECMHVFSRSGDMKVEYIRF